MRLRLSIHGEAVEAQTEAWITALIHVVGGRPTEQSKSIEVLRAYKTRDVRIRLGGEALTQPVQAWVCLLLRRLPWVQACQAFVLARGSIVVRAEGRLVVPELGALKPGDIEMVRPDASPAVANAENWIAAIAQVLSGEQRTQLFQLVGQVVPDTPGHYVLHAEGLDTLLGGA